MLVNLKYPRNNRILTKGLYEITIKKELPQKKANFAN